MAQGSTHLTVDADMFGEEGEAELTAWLVQDGEQVEAEQVVAELSTSKAIVEVPAPIAGRLTRLAETGATVMPGQSIATIERESA